MQTLSHKESQLVCILHSDGKHMSHVDTTMPATYDHADTPQQHMLTYLTWSWDSDSSWPVVVHVSELVGEALEMVRLESRVITHHSVMGRCDSALTYVLTHQEEVIPTDALSHTHTHTCKH